MKKLLLLGMTVLSFNWMFAQCNILYVSTTGVPTATGVMSDPMDIVSAFINATPGTVIRMGAGTYNIQSPLTISVNDLTIEGGFNPSNAWTKSSLAGATTIFKEGILAEGTVNAQRLVAIYASNVSGFRFQDITISTADAYSPGMSTYGVHINNCSNYKFVRTQILPGNASDGADGVSGTIGAVGGIGVMGASGSCDGGDCTFGSGDAGAAGGNGGLGGGGTTIGTGGPATNGTQNNGTNGGAGVGRNGGAGGGGGAGGDECTTNNGGNGGNGGNSACGNGPTGGIRGNQGDPGADGANGTNGSTGANGANGVNGPLGTDIAGFWTPGTAGTNGADGCGGTGGSGGGGGGRQTCSLCDNGPGNGGSGGGGGGQGGTGGTCGLGGGASFGLYIVNNGANAEVNQSSIVAGFAGQGGAGGTGGPGAGGGLGALRRTTCNGEIGEGGAGGNGGAGGVGGEGGDGANGISISVQLVSGDALVLNDNNFNLLAQPEIRASYSTCTSNTITFEDVSIAQGTGVTDWDFGMDATPSAGVDNPQDVSFATIGFKDVLHSATTYVGFINITCESEATTLTETICSGDSFMVGSSTYNASGTYTDVLTTLNGCDSTITLNLTVEDINSAVTLAGITLTATQSGGTYQWVDCGNGNLPIGGATNQSYTATANGSYAVVLTFNGCSETSSCTAVTTVGIEEITNFSNLVLYPNPTNGQFTINFGNEYDEVLIEITEANGKKVKKQKFRNTSNEAISFTGQSGIYFVTITSEDQTRTVRLIKD
jgi:hypothetical protein